MTVCLHAQTCTVSLDIRPRPAASVMALALHRVTFQPYTRAQLVNIITQRLKDADALEAFDPNAITFAARKVASCLAVLCKWLMPRAGMQPECKSLDYVHFVSSLSSLSTLNALQGISPCAASHHIRPLHHCAGGEQPATCAHIAEDMSGGWCTLSWHMHTCRLNSGRCCRWPVCREMSGALWSCAAKLLSCWRLRQQTRHPSPAPAKPHGLHPQEHPLEPT